MPPDNIFLKKYIKKLCTSILFLGNREAGNALPAGKITVRPGK
jgi:hypothetical protein